MKKYWISAVIIFFSTYFSIAQIHQSDGLRMPGDWNSWVNDTDMGGDFDLQLITSGTLRWQSIFQYTGETGANQFKFVSTSYGNTWGNQWGGNASVALNQLSNFTFSTNPDIANNSVNVTANKWYTVVFEDKGYQNSRAVIMETTAQPVNIETVLQNPLIVSSQNSVAVTANLSASPSAEERFFTRYSVNGWSTSAVLPMSIYSQSASATIPAQPSETEVEYYVFSTTKSNPTEDIDLFSIRLNNNSGNNYTYIVDQTVECGQQVGVVTTSPAFPLDDAAVSIYFNAAFGNGGLFNYEGDIYVHTGLITSLSTSTSDWKYIKTEWGENTPETLMDSIGDNIYQLNINNIRSFYGVPSGEDILKMAFVFRGGEPNEDGDYPEHKNSDNSDIFVDVYELELNVKILSPSPKEPLVSPNQLIAVCVEALENTTLSLYLNNELITSESTSSLTYPLVLESTQAGTHWIKAVAGNGVSTIKDSVSIYLRGNVVVEELPEGVSQGVNYIDDNSVTLVLHDPAGYKQFAFAIGEFSNWMPNDENFMKNTPDGKYFWVALTGLNPQKEYAYQYFIDGNLKVADPFSKKILDPWNDRWISSTTYPYLKEYPFDSTTGIVSTFQTDQTEYTWQVEDFEPVALNETQQDLVIYELLVRDFVDSKSIKKVIDKLDYIQSIGVNAIELMPIMEFDGNESWGYAPNFFFATDKYYGTKLAYKQFVDECHKRGIAVIFDVVLNHAFGQNPMVQMYFDSEAGDHGQPDSSNPWLNPQATHPYSVGYDFNHESQHTRNFFKKFFEYWLTEFKADGFRLDLSKGLTQTYSGGDIGIWGAYDQSRINIITDYFNHIKSVNPNAYVILEHFAVNDEEKVLANTGMMLWSAMHNNYKQVAMGHQSSSDISWAYHGSRGWNYPNLIDYMENHDEERLMYEALTYGNSSDSYNLRDTLTALKHMEMAAVLFFGIPGPKMVWQFEELGYDYSINYGGDRTSPKPPRWDYWNVPEREKLQRVYNAMIQLRSSDAFRLGTFTHDLGGLGKRMWISHSSMNVVIAANMGVEGFSMSPGFQSTGTWYEYFSGDTIEVSDPSGHSFYFGPGEYKVFVNQLIEKPFYSVNITIFDSESSAPVEGAQVSLSSSGSRITDSNGFAPFSSLAGTFTLDVSKSGYTTKQQEINVNDDMNLEILLSPNTTSFNENSNKCFARIYPNPASSRVIVEAKPNSWLFIHDIHGRLVHKQYIINQLNSVDVSSFGKGVFIVSVKSMGNYQMMKLVLH